jgi:phospholipid/cholesterol/gamma-HCH transport system ATP-binding protein
MPEPLVELRGISKAFGNQRVLDNIDLCIYPDDALAILGPSGTGKSTVLRLIAGLLEPDSGEIYIAGERRQGLLQDGHHHVRMSMVFQQSALFDSLTVGENVGFYLYHHTRLPEARIREIVSEKLAMVGLSGMEDLYPAQLSGGMRKRVSLARAIADNPDDTEDDPRLLLYDEPTAGLDPIASTVVEQLIRDLKERTGHAYAIVTHQNSTIERTGDRLILLYQGRICWQGSRTEAKTTDNPYLRQFLTGDVTGPIRVLDQVGTATL